MSSSRNVRVVFLTASPIRWWSQKQPQSRDYMNPTRVEFFDHDLIDSSSLKYHSLLVEIYMQEIENFQNGFIS